EVGEEIGPPRRQHGGGPVIGHELGRVGHGDRSEVAKRRQSHHDAKGLTAISSAGWPNADSTARGAGKVNSGSRSGPTRGVLPWRRGSGPLSTLSGVIGVSSTRPPTAWPTRFRTARM